MVLWGGWVFTLLSPRTWYVPIRQVVLLNMQYRGCQTYRVSPACCCFVLASPPFFLRGPARTPAIHISFESNTRVKADCGCKAICPLAANVPTPVHQSAL
jgi:hypothetical protein